MGYSAESIDRRLIPEGEAMNTYATFLHPEGLQPIDTYVTLHGFILPAEETSRLELEALKKAVISGELPLSLPEGQRLPSLRQLERITVAAITGCWELPVYKDGEDVYPPGSPLAGKPRARYGKLSIADIEGDTAHITMSNIFRGPVRGQKKYHDHICNNKSCCWHRHIERVTPAVNTSRGREYGQVAAGQLILFNRQPETV